MNHTVSVLFSTEASNISRPTAKIVGDVKVDVSASDGLGSPIAVALEAFIRALQNKGFKVILDDV